MPRSTTPSVCVVGPGWRFTSGVSYYTHRLTEALSGRRRASAVLVRGLIPRLLYPGRSRVGVPVNEASYGPDVAVFDGVDWFWIPSIFRAIRFLRRQRPDVLVLEWWTGAVLHTYLVLALAARASGTKLVVEFHETQDTGEARMRLAALYVRVAGRLLLDRASWFVAHSEHDRAELVRLFHLPEQRVTVIPHGPFDQHVAEAAAPPADLVPVPDSRFVLLFFGTIRPYKGLEHLVEAFDALTPDEVSGLQLLVVGEPWEHWDLPLRMLRDSKYRDHITVIDRYVHDREVTACFARADAVVLPYTRSSASGPLHIAMANGLPVILSDVGGLRAGAEGYEGVLWVPPQDAGAIAAAIRRVVGMRGERFADPRSWAATAESYEQIFARISG